MTIFDSRQQIQIADADDHRLLVPVPSGKPRSNAELLHSFSNSTSKPQVSFSTTFKTAFATLSTMVLAGDMYLILSPDPCGTAERNGTGYQSESDTEAVDPEPTISIGMALDVLWHDKKHATDMKKILLAMISFCIFVAAMFLHIPTANMYHQHYGVSSILATSGDDTVTSDSPVKFYNIETIPDIFEWLNDTFIPQVFVTTDYNGAALPEDQKVGLQRSTRCWELFTLRQERQRKVAEFFNAATTYHRHHTQWTTSRYAVTKLQFNFNDGGYVEPSASTTSALLDQYPSTTPIVVDILVALWFSPWILVPAIISYGRTYAKKHRLSNPQQWLKLAKHIAKAIGVWAFPDGWFAIDFFRGPIVYLFYITVLITQAVTMNSEFRRKLVTLGEAGQADEEASENLASVTRSFRLIANLTVLLRLLATAAVLVLGLRILNTFRDHVGLSILTRTMAIAVRSFWTFSVIFAVVFVAFAAAGTVLFGDRVQDFSSFLSSMKSCVNMIYGDFDFDSIKDIDYSVVYYWAYMAMETFVLLNIVLAIVVDAIRPIVLHDTLRAKLDEARSSDPSLEWSPQTLITPITLNKIFPEARIQECKATIAHLAVEQKHQSSHDLHPLVSKTKLDDIRPVQSPGGGNSAYPPTQKYNRQLSGSELQSPNINQLIARMDTLEQKLDNATYDPDDTFVYEFVVPYNYSALEAAATLEEKGSWLNASTKELLITVPTLNSEIPGYVVTTLSSTSSATGTLNPASQPLQRFFMALETFVLLNIVLAIVIDAYNVERIKKERTNGGDADALLSICFAVLSKTVDRLPSQSCLCFKERHQVVFWGRIRSKRLRSVLRNKLDSSEWTPDTILTSEKLEQLFPDASEIECENTMKYLVAGICKYSNPEDSNSNDVVSLAPVSASKDKTDSGPAPDVMDASISTLTIDSSNRSTSEIQDLTIRLAGSNTRWSSSTWFFNRKLTCWSRKCRCR
ncbi:Polycystin cation channel, PKD1/PKD2 [Phytophthora cactorum]|nr:Polycystin cation channel, PKD1/PKD2 [Phytophthora cactorum]